MLNDIEVRYEDWQSFFSSPRYLLLIEAELSDVDHAPSPIQSEFDGSFFHPSGAVTLTPTPL